MLVAVAVVPPSLTLQQVLSHDFGRPLLVLQLLGWLALRPPLLGRVAESACEATAIGQAIHTMRIKDKMKRTQVRRKREEQEITRVQRERLPFARRTK